MIWEAGQTTASPDRQKKSARLQNHPKTKDFVSWLQNMISPRLLGVGGWNFYPFRISDNFFIFWSFPVPIIRRCSPIIYPPGWPSYPARSSKSRKSWILLADFTFWISQRLLGVCCFAWELFKCLFLRTIQVYRVAKTIPIKTIFE